MSRQRNDAEVVEVEAAAVGDVVAAADKCVENIDAADENGCSACRQVAVMLSKQNEWLENCCRGKTDAFADAVVGDAEFVASETLSTSLENVAQRRPSLDRLQHPPEHSASRASCASFQ